MQCKIKILVLSIMLSGGVCSVFGDVSSSYYYSMNTSGGYTSQADEEFKSETDSSFRFLSGSTTRMQRSSGYDYTPRVGGGYDVFIHSGDAHSQANVNIDSANAILKGRVVAETKEEVKNVRISAHTSLDMGVRQYYRAEGSSPMTLKLSFHYDGSWDDGGGDNFARVALGTYLTRVKDESAYFAGGVEAERPLDIMLFTDFAPGPNFYDAYFGQGQEIADTLAHDIYFSNQSKYLPSGSLDYDVNYEVVVNPGELILVDTMFNARVSAIGGAAEMTSDVDFLNTAYSSVEIVSGGGSLVPQAMPVSIPEPAALVLIGIGALVLRAVRYR